jgi:hypothetical protein
MKIIIAIGTPTDFRLNKTYYKKILENKSREGTLLLTLKTILPFPLKTFLKTLKICTVIILNLLSQAKDR